MLVGQSNLVLKKTRADSVDVNTIKHYFKRLWLASIATILSKAFKIHSLFMSTTAHN